MAALPSGSIDKLWAQIMAEWSRRRLPTGALDKDDFRTTIVDMDAGLDSSEAGILAGISVPSARTWLQTNQDIGREILVAIMRERQGVL